MVLTTLGYEGLSISTFFTILLENNISTIVDIRELPLSRKTGFSKSALAEIASRHELNYVHMRSLGCPRQIRYDYRADRDWERYSTRFLAYLDTQFSEIEHLAEIVQNTNCCLLCFEADHVHCHRSYVAEAVAERTENDLDIMHLQAPRT